MKANKSINQITIMNFLSTIILQGMAFFTLPVFSRMMSAESYGIFVSFTTWTSIITCIFSLQVSASFMGVFATLPQEEQKPYQSSVLALGLLSFAGFSMLMVLFRGSVERLLNLPENLFFPLLATAWTQMIITFANDKYLMEFEAEKRFLLSILGTGVGLLLSLGLIFVVPREINYLARVWGNLIPNLFISFVFCILVFKHGKTFFRLNYWKECLGISVPLIFHLLSGTILVQSDRVMIQRMLGDSLAGIYGLAAFFSSIIQVINTALNSSWSPFYMKYLAKGDRGKINRHAKNYAEVFTIVCIGFILLSPEVYAIIVGSEFLEGVKYIPLLVIANYFIFLYTFPVNFEYYCKNSKIIASATILSAMFNVAANYFLIGILGIKGALIATVASNLFLFIGHSFCAKTVFRMFDYPLSIKLFLPYLSVLLLVSLLSGILGYNGAVLRWSVGAGLGIIELYRIIQRKSIL